MVCSPQYICGFSGPSANWGTHLFYLNKLEPFWRTIPRLSANSTKKDQTGLNLFAMVVLGTGYVTNQIARLGWKMNTFMNNLFTKMITTRYCLEMTVGLVTPVMAETLSQEIKIIIPHNIILWLLLPWECLIIMKQFERAV